MQDTNDAAVRQHENSAASVRAQLVTQAQSLANHALEARTTAGAMIRAAAELPSVQADHLVRAALDAQNAAELLRARAVALSDAIGAAAAEEAIRKGAGVRPMGRGRYASGIEL